MMSPYEIKKVKAMEANQANQANQDNQANQANQCPLAKDLLCAFATLVPLYKNLGLLECETKSLQTMRHASSKLSQDCLPLYNNFFPELVQIQTHLEDFSLCEKHYNQIIVSDFLRQMLVSSNIPKNRCNNQKRQINSNNFDNRIIEKQARYSHETDVEKNICEVGVQVNQETHDVGIQVSNITLESRVYLLQLQLNSKINEIEDLKKQLDYAYDYVMESWERVQELSKINKEITEQNNVLKFSSGSYTKFVNWLESLAIESEPLPEGLLFLAFDNEQRGQHNYLDRGYNTVIYHTVMSFVALNMNKNDLTQFVIAPWLNDSLTDEEYENIKNQKGAAGQSKWCKKCNTTNIDNKKRTCPKCNEKLDTLAALQAESANELAQFNNTASQSKPPIIKSHFYTHEQKSSHFERISIIQRSEPDDDVIVLEMMIDIKKFAIIQGYRTENQLGYFKKCANHHKSWDSICNIYRYAITCELLWPYVVATENPSADGYLDWAKKQNDHKYKLKFEQAIINFRTGVRNNRPLLVNTARRMFAPAWSGCRHPLYHLIEITYEEQLMRLNPEIRQRIESYSVISQSGYHHQHQGLEAILEEVNKSLKALIPPVPSQKHWRISARNCTKFIKLRHILFNIIGYTDNKSSGGNDRTFKSLGDEHLLSEKLKNFRDLACERRIKFINETFKENRPNHSLRPIPVTAQEEAAAMDEANMSKEELLLIINSLLNSVNISDHPKYHGLKQRNRTQLQEILQNIRDLHNEQDEPEDEIELEN
ncbi:hypothetical protein C2G38_2038690 [Gigaspora rosea]|uniref:Uncharacterized protein n=1 Tax=Gigaspora rosea TaxID=44941 RepID=A0A397V1K9_9GLOM|nr:hypothetical protein C2G38_2038690 [Gigaspora rosea]